MMREFLARAYRYRHDLGDPSGLEVAQALAAEVDNPALRRRVERAPRPAGEATASPSLPRGAVVERRGRG